MGGAERLCITICKELFKRGHDVKIILFDAKNEYQDSSKELNYKVIPSNFSLKFLRGMSEKPLDLEKYISHFKPQVIHSHLYEAEVVSRNFLFKDIAYFSHIHSHLIEFRRHPIHKFFRKETITKHYEFFRLLTKYNKCNNTFISISESVKNHLLKRKSLKKFDNHVLYNAIDLSLFTYKPRTINKEKIRCISIGRLEPIKGHEFLLDVISQVNKKLHVEFTLIGEGSLNKKLMNLILEKKLSGIVTIKKNTTKIHKELETHDLYIHGSIDEPFGLVMAEAMASGLPIITTETAGSKILIDSSCGIVITNRNKINFSNAISSLFNNKDLYNKLSKGAIKKSKHFGIENYVDKLESYYLKKIK